MLGVGHILTTTHPSRSSARSLVPTMHHAPRMPKKRTFLAAIRFYPSHQIDPSNQRADGTGPSIHWLCVRSPESNRPAMQQAAAPRFFKAGPRRARKRLSPCFFDAGYLVLTCTAHVRGTATRREIPTRGRTDTLLQRRPLCARKGSNVEPLLLPERTQNRATQQAVVDDARESGGAARPGQACWLRRGCMNRLSRCMHEATDPSANLHNHDT